VAHQTETGDAAPIRKAPSVEAGNGESSAGLIREGCAVITQIHLKINHN